MTKKQVKETLMKLEYIAFVVKDLKDDIANGYDDFALKNNIRLKAMIRLTKELKVIDTEENAQTIRDWLLEN